MDMEKNNQKEYGKKWREKNKEHRKEWGKKYRQEHRKYFKEYNKKYYEKNREYLIECNKKYNKEKRIGQKEYDKNYYKKNRGKILKRKKIYGKSEEGRISDQKKGYKRRIREKCIIDTLTAQEWLDILEKYNYRCAYCGVEFNCELPPEKDHIIPISKGGHNTKENIVPACKSCNSRKGNRTMYNKEFEKGFAFIIKWEGGYSDDKNDPGGETKFGISKRSYPELDISKLTLEKAKEIYYKNYWLKNGCDDLPFPFNIVVFDTAVNMGRRRALEFLNAYSDWRDYLLLRLYTYSKFKQAKLYFRGWANRTLDLYDCIKKNRL